MSEAYGYYTYGDIKDKILRGEPSYGVSKINDSLYIISKNTTCYTPVYNKSLTDTIKNIKYKQAVCGDYSLSKSANIQYYYMNGELVSPLVGQSVSVNECSVNIDTGGYYTVETIGQIMKHDFNMTAQPEGAIIKINGIETNSYIAYDTEEVEYEVSATDYATVKNTVIITEDTNLNIVLKPKVILTINPTPVEAIVTINGIISNTIEIGQGDSVTYKVELDGYITVEETIIIEEDTTLDITLLPAAFEFNYPTTQFPQTGISTSGIGTSSSYAFQNINSTLRSASGSYNVNSGKSYAYISFTTPNEETELSISCYVSSENNYDFGAISVGTAYVTPTQAQMKAGTNPSSAASYLYRSSGSQSTTTVTRTLSPNTKYYISLAYAKDGSGNTGSDRFFVTSIKFKYV